MTMQTAENIPKVLIGMLLEKRNVEKDVDVTNTNNNTNEAQTKIKNMCLLTWVK